MEEKKRSKLSKGLLDMKFMKKTKERVQQDENDAEGQAMYSSEITNNMKRSGDTYFFEKMEEEKPLKLSKGLLDMKFMKKTKERVEQDENDAEGQAMYSSEITNNMKRSGNIYFFEEMEVEKPSSLSKRALDMKFMKKTKERVEQEEDDAEGQAMYSSEITNKKKRSGNVYFFEKKEEEKRPGLSKGLLDMKFMKKTKERVQQDEDDAEELAMYSNEIPNEMEESGNIHFTEVSLATCRGFIEGRLSFGGMNPDIENLMNKDYVKKLEEIKRRNEKDVTDVEMAEEDRRMDFS